MLLLLLLMDVVIGGAIMFLLMFLVLVMRSRLLVLHRITSRYKVVLNVLRRASPIFCCRILMILMLVTLSLLILLLLLSLLRGLVLLIVRDRGSMVPSSRLTGGNGPLQVLQVVLARRIWKRNRRLAQHNQLGQFALI